MFGEFATANRSKVISAVSLSIGQTMAGIAHPA